MGLRGVDKAVEALALAYAPEIPPPPGVTFSEPDEMSLWQEIINSRARAEWNRTDLHRAATLVRLVFDLERISRQAQNEEPTITTEKGAEVANPIFGVLAQLTAREIAICRSLHLTASSSVHDVSKLRPQRNAERAAREKKLGMEQSPDASSDDDLLAKPQFYQ